MARKAKKLQEMTDMFEDFDVNIINLEDVTVLKELHLRMSETSDTRDL